MYIRHGVTGIGEDVRNFFFLPRKRSLVDLSIQLAGLFFVVQIFSEPSNTVHASSTRAKKKRICKSPALGMARIPSTPVGTSENLRFCGGGKVSIESDMVIVDNHTYNSSHGNTSVLAFDSSATLEGLGLSFEPIKRIINTKRGGDTDLEFIYVQGSGGRSLLGRGEGSGGTSKEGGKSELHFVYNKMEETGCDQCYASV